MMSAVPELSTTATTKYTQHLAGRGLCRWGRLLALLKKVLRILLLPLVVLLIVLVPLLGRALGWLRLVVAVRWWWRGQTALIARKWRLSRSWLLPRDLKLDGRSARSQFTTLVPTSSDRTQIHQTWHP